MFQKAAVVPTEPTLAEAFDLTSNIVLFPVWFFLAFMGPFAIFMFALTKVGKSTADASSSYTSAVKYVYICSVGQCYRFFAPIVTLYTYYFAKPLFSFLGDNQQIMTYKNIDMLTMAYIDLLAGIGAGLTYVYWSRNPKVCMYIIFFLGMGWLDHCLVAYRMMFVEGFGPVPNLGLDALGFLIFATASSLWQGSTLGLLLINEEVHTYFGLVSPKKTK